jgi:hypothetical protein
MVNSDASKWWNGMFAMTSDLKHPISPRLSLVDDSLTINLTAGRCHCLLAVCVPHAITEWPNLRLLIALSTAGSHVIWCLPYGKMRNMLAALTVPTAPHNSQSSEAAGRVKFVVGSRVAIRPWLDECPLPLRRAPDTACLCCQLPQACRPRSFVLGL